MYRGETEHVSNAHRATKVTDLINELYLVCDKLNVCQLTDFMLIVSALGKSMSVWVYVKSS